MSFRHGQRVYCQFGNREGPLAGTRFVSAQRIFGPLAFTFDSHLPDSLSKPAEINQIVSSVNDLGRKVAGLTAHIPPLAGITMAQPLQAVVNKPAFPRRSRFSPCSFLLCAGC